jgi:hypothetical protein
MNIRIYGFGLIKTGFPEAVAAFEVLDALIENAGKPLGKKHLIHAGAARIPIKYDGQEESWYGGLIFRARDAKSFNQLIEENGELVLTAKQLEGGNKIAELCYFLAHPETGNGLIACYHGGPGVPMLERVLRSMLSGVRRSKMKEAFADAGKDRAKKDEVFRIFKGELKLSHLVRKGTLKELFAELTRVTSLELRLSTVEMTTGLFSKMKAKAVTEIKKLKFAPDFNFDEELMEELIADIDAEEVDGASIVGKNSKGETKIISSDALRNKMIFDEKDYDELLGTFTLQLKDWDKTISESSVIHWLQAISRTPANRSLLFS